MSLRLLRVRRRALGLLGCRHAIMHALRTVRPLPVFAVAIVCFASATDLGAASPADPRVTFTQLAACPLVDSQGNVTGSVADSMPAATRALDGRTVRITGYMLPVALENGRAREFLLMRTTTACCYGKMPAANEYLVVTAGGEGVAVTMDVPVAIQGVLKVKPVIENGTVVQFYRLEGATLAKAQP